MITTWSASCSRSRRRRPAFGIAARVRAVAGGARWLLGCLGASNVARFVVVKYAGLRARVFHAESSASGDGDIPRHRRDVVPVAASALRRGGSRRSTQYFHAGARPSPRSSSTRSRGPARSLCSGALTTLTRTRRPGACSGRRAARRWERARAATTSASRLVYLPLLAGPTPRRCRSGHGVEGTSRTRFKWVHETPRAGLHAVFLGVAPPPRLTRIGPACASIVPLAFSPLDSSATATRRCDF